MIFTKSLCFASIMRFSSRSRLMVMVFFSFSTIWIYPRISKRGQYITSGPWRQVRRLKFYGFIQEITSAALPSSRVTHVVLDHWMASGRRLKARRRRRRRRCGSSRWWWRCSRGLPSQEVIQILVKSTISKQNDVKCVVFGYTCKWDMSILSHFCHTFCDRNVTDCANDFVV